MAYFHGIITTLLTLGTTGDVPRGSDSTQNSRTCLKKLGDIRERPERLRLFQELVWDYIEN